MAVKGIHLHIYNRFEKVQSLEQYFKLEFKKTEHDLLQLNDSIVVIPDTKSNLTYFPKQECDLDTVSQNGRLIAKCKDCFLILYIYKGTG
jgi:predicted fused transcriptional regulator/phosphomethylpyrimidine kinase